MGRPKQDAPSYFGDLVAAAIKRGMDQFDMSGRALARRLGRSEGYVRDRLKGEYEWSLADVEGFALIVGMNPEAFIASIDREALRPLLVDRGTPEIEAKSLGEVLGGRSDVGGLEDDEAMSDRQADYDRVARKRAKSRGEDDGFTA